MTIKTSKGTAATDPITNQVDNSHYTQLLRNGKHLSDDLKLSLQSSFANRYGRYADVVAALGVSRTTLYRWTLLDDFPAEAMKKRGSIVLFNLDVLEAWLAGEVTA